MAGKNHTETGDQQSDMLASTEQLLASANESTRHIRSVYLTFLLLLTYTAVIIGSTTDEQLLRVERVTLPILDVGLPIVEFYVLTPWLIVLFHFNLLLQFSLTARSLHDLNDSIGNIRGAETIESVRAQLFPFPFSHLLAGNHPSLVMRFFLTLIVWTTVILLPLVLLLWAQLRFLPYHSIPVTWSHRLAILTDLTLLWVLWPMIMMPAADVRNWWRGFSLGWLAVFRRMFYRMRVRRNSRPGGGAIAAESRTVAPGVLILIVTTLLVLPFSVFVAVIPGAAMESLVAGHVPRSWLSRTVNYEGNKYLALTQRLFDSETAPFHRNLQLAEGIFVAGEVDAETIAGLGLTDHSQRQAALKRLRGINLSGRDLRMANFYQAMLPKADLREADLRGARLVEANMQQARLEKANLRGANLANAELQHANLEEANLQHARMFRVNLTSANLKNAELQNVRLDNAVMQRCSLSKAQLQRAELCRAEMIGADLSSAELQGANLCNAKMYDARLPKAKLIAANLEGAILTGAYLHGARMQGAVLIGAGLQGANLAFADMSGADLAHAAVGGATFNQTRLGLSNLEFIDREPFSENDYASEMRQLNRMTNVDSLRDKIQGLLKNLVGKNDNLEFGSHTKKAFCDAEQIKLGCVEYEKPETGRWIDRYDREVAPYLLKLACVDADVAGGMAERAKELGFRFRNRLLGPLLADGLLSEDCAASQHIPEGDRRNLEEISKHLEYLRH